MVYQSRPGESEFGGVAGPFPDEQLLAPTMQQEVWSIYATNEAGGVDEEGDDTATEEWGRKHIGMAKRSASPGAGG